MQLATGYACSLNDMLVRFPYEKCKSLPKEKYKAKSLIKKIFKESIKMVMDDVIEGDIFTLPSMGNSKGEIHMESFTGEDFMKARKNGKFKKVDFLKTNFTAYFPFLYMLTKNDTVYTRKKKPIYLNRLYSDKIVNNENSGKQYSS